MINVLKKKKCVIYAPANGKVVDLSKVPDPVFSKKMMGEGVGLIFEGDTLFAPLDGKVKLVASTKHAIGFEANNKAEILMHIGLDTVTNKGKSYLMIETDYSRADKGQIRTRLEAFLETLEK